MRGDQPTMMKAVPNNMIVPSSFPGYIILMVYRILIFPSCGAGFLGSEKWPSRLALPLEL